MSPGGTMARVYQALKSRVMAGTFAPGERIDPARLSDDLSASATPIRDALHRLAGERLVESWQQEGFRQPFLTEAILRDLYGWAGDLVQVATRAAERPAGSPPPTPPLDQDEPSLTGNLMNWIALHSPNAEHAAAMASLTDRLHVIRLAEARLFEPTLEELGQLVGLVELQRWPQVRQWSVAHFSQRLKRLPDIVAMLSRRSA